MSANEIEEIKTSSLQDISPFVVDYPTANLQTKITREGKKYQVVVVVVSPLELKDQKYTVPFYTNEYKSIVALRDSEGIQATPTLNQKTGAVTNIYQRWSKK